MDYAEWCQSACRKDPQGSLHHQTRQDRPQRCPIHIHPISLQQPNLPTSDHQSHPHISNLNQAAERSLDVDSTQRVDMPLSRPTHIHSRCMRTSPDDQSDRVEAAHGLYLSHTMASVLLARIFCRSSWGLGLSLVNLVWCRWVPGWEV